LIDHNLIKPEKPFLENLACHLFAVVEAVFQVQIFDINTFETAWVFRATNKLDW
jgi:hypothetical protein